MKRELQPSSIKTQIVEDKSLLNELCDAFQISDSIERHVDSSYDEKDIRLNFFVDNQWVLKVNSKNELNESTFREISKVIENYNRCGMYAPRYKRSVDGNYLYTFNYKSHAFVAYVEEYAPYPMCQVSEGAFKREVLEALGKYLQEYTEKDLMTRNSMWSIIALPVLSEGVDEKEENFQMLYSCLIEEKETSLAENLNNTNRICRQRIAQAFSKLRRCSIQGDLNETNLLCEDGHFVGLIDFNMSGTEVNINTILNETRPSMSRKDFETLSPEEIYLKMEKERNENLEAVFKNYTLDAIEREYWNDYKRIVDLFLWPYVALWTTLIKEKTHKDKVFQLIHIILKED